MDRRNMIVVIDSSDSDDCKIVETRSAPRRPLVPMIPGPRHPHFDQTGQRIRLPPGGQARISSRTDPKRDYTQSTTHATAPMRRVSSPSRRPRTSSADTPARFTHNIAKLLSTKTDYLDRHVDARQIRRCTTCIQDSRCCDGGNPCASCFDPGFPCIYPGEGLTLFRQQATISARERGQTHESSPFSKIPQNEKNQSAHSESMGSSSVLNSAPIADNDHRGIDHMIGNLGQSSIYHSNDVQRFADSTLQIINNSGKFSARGTENVQNDAELLADHEDKDQDEVDDDRSDEDSDLAIMVQDSGSVDIEQIPTTLWLPGSLDEMQKLILTHEANIKSHREYMVEAQLAGARLKTWQNIHIAREEKGANPFRKMIAQQSATSAAGSAPIILDVKIKAKRGDFTTLKLPVGLLREDNVAHIPEYKSIGRLRSTFLARNVHGLKYVPYHAGIEEKDLSQRKHDLETHFKDHSTEEFRRQRECLELVYQWSDDFDEILEEIQITPPQLWKWISQSSLAKCQKCQTSCGKAPASLSLDISFTRDEKQRCHWLYEVFMKITKIGIWHFVSHRPGQLEKTKPESESKQESKSRKEHTICSLCFTHNCMTHGSYVDKGVTDDAGEAAINDPEEHNNERRRTVLSVGTRNLPHHTCGLYCLGSEFPGLHDTHMILGLDGNDDLNGLRNEGIKMITDLGPFRGKEPCVNHCFINREDRPLRSSMPQDPLNNISKTTRQLIHSMTKLYGRHVRLPCMISKLTKIDCMAAFFLLLQTYKDGHIIAPIEEKAHNQAILDIHKMPPKVGVYNTVKSMSLENRRAWMPCSHDGPCSSGNSNCSCAREQVHCEKSCGCSDGCRRRFRGCRCKKKCFLDDRCECYVANRECDPQLCHDCGVEEVLEPSNKYREDVRVGRCRNNRLQLDLPPRTVKGMSEVQGWGLFLGEDLPSNSFVGEYKGENVSASESDRRGAIYAYVSQEYLFNLNRDHQLDGSRFGNKTRFINNSKAKEFINVFPKVMFVNGVTRIGLFTNRVMKAGEELLYDYGYPADLVQGEFWEKHERAIEHNGVVAPIAKPKFRPRMAKNAVDTPGNEDEERSPIRKVALIVRQKKRKRPPNVEFEDSDAATETTANVRVPIVGMIADSESSEYEESSQANDMSTAGSADEEEEEEDDEDESEDELAKPTKPIDRRRGGEAQRRAALTRKLNKQRGR